MKLDIEPSLELYLPLYNMDGACFCSRDSRGLPCAVVGALWRPDGYRFDGINDYINAGAVLDFGSGDFSILVWVAADADRAAALGDILTDDLGGTKHYRLGVNNSHCAQFSVRSGTNMATVVDTIAINDGSWYFLSGVRQGADFLLYRDGTLAGQDSNVAVGDVDNDLGGQDWVGNTQELGGRFPFDGRIGEVMVYARALASIEIEQVWKATRWRYR